MSSAKSRSAKDELDEGREAQRIFGEKKRKWEKNEKIRRKRDFFIINH